MTETTPNDSFQRYLLLSIGLHVSIVLLFTVRMLIFPSEPVVFQSALRVDLVALPDKLQTPAPAAPVAAAEPEKPAASPPKAAEAPKPSEPTVNLNPTKPEKPDPKAPKVDPKKTERAQDAAINRLKQQSAIEKMEQEFRAAEAAKARTFKGNVISKGSELTGINQLEHDEFVAAVERHVRAQWALPQWLANKELKAQVRVKFDDKGNVIGKQLVKSSGNAAFDDVVMDTITKASPAPAPPEKFVRLLANEGILFGFPE